MGESHDEAKENPVLNVPDHDRQPQARLHLPGQAPGFPGVSRAPSSPDIELQQPLPVLIVDGKPWCPHCNAPLSESGAVRIPMFEYAELDMRGAKIGASYNTDFEPSIGQTAQCVTCHGELAGSGAWDW